MKSDRCEHPGCKATDADHLIERCPDCREWMCEHHLRQKVPHQPAFHVCEICIQYYCSSCGVRDDENGATVLFGLNIGPYCTDCLEERQMRTGRRCCGRT
jgi:hypothetical protein